MTDRFSWKQHFEEGMTYGQASNLEKAEDAFRQAIALAPGEPYPHYELGYTLFLTGRLREALEELKATNSLAEGFFLVQTEIYLCEQVLSGGIGKEVLEQLRHLQQLTDAGGGHSGEAIQLSSHVIQEAPGCALGHYYLGKALLQQDPQRAETALARCLELGPDDTTAIDASLHLAILYRDSGRQEQGKELCRAVSSKFQSNPHSLKCKLVFGGVD